MDDFSGKSPSSLTDNHLRAIGAVVVNWTSLEMVMEIMILGFYEVNPNRGLVLTSNVSFQNKLAILRILATKGAIKEAGESKNFLDLLERVEKAHVKRNIVAHGLWSGGKVDGLARRMAIRVRGRRLSTVDEQVPLADLEATANEFLAMRVEMNAFADRLGVRPPLPGSE